MILSRQIIRLFVVFLSVFLVSCASFESTRKGPSIDIFPVFHTLLLAVERTPFENAKQQLNIYLDEYSEILVTQNVQLNWSNEASEMLANFAKKRLISMGVAPGYIQIRKVNALTDAHFDFEIKVVQHQVADIVCEKSKSQNYFLSDNGCFTENARWKSMVAPERMLPDLGQLQE